MIKRIFNILLLTGLCRGAFGLINVLQARHVVGATPQLELVWPELKVMNENDQLVRTSDVRSGSGAACVEPEQPGVTTAEVWRKHSLSPSLLYSWRAVAQDGAGSALLRSAWSVSLLAAVARGTTRRPSNRRPARRVE